MIRYFLEEEEKGKSKMVLMVKSESRFEEERWLGVSTTLLFKTGLPGHQFSVFAYNIVNPVLL